LQRQLMKTRATLTSQVSEDERVRFTQQLRDHLREVAENALKEMQLRWNVGDSSWLLDAACENPRSAKAWTTVQA
jgi:hypothetical protein